MPALEKDALIPFHPLSVAVSGLEAFGRQVCEIGASARPHPPPAPPRRRVRPTGPAPSLESARMPPLPRARPVYARPSTESAQAPALGVRLPLTRVEPRAALIKQPRRVAAAESPRLAPE